jgi:hypothetical protein
MLTANVTLNYMGDFLQDMPIDGSSSVLDDRPRSTILFPARSQHVVFLRLAHEDRSAAFHLFGNLCRAGTQEQDSFDTVWCILQKVGLNKGQFGSAQEVMRFAQNLI